MTKLYLNNGRFKVMQVTDVHLKPGGDVDTFRLLERVLETESPDLVIFTGDQLKGYSFAYRGENRQQKVEQAIQELLAPLETRGIPFAVTFGNHDRQAGLTNEQQLKIYRQSPCYTAGQYELDAGTRCLYIYDDNGIPAFSLFLIDSQGAAQGGGYEAVLPQQIEWFSEIRREQFGPNGKHLPALVFQHIPVPEYYDILEETPRKAGGAIRGYRTQRGRLYRLDALGDRELFAEAPCMPDENTGEFNALLQDGNVLALFCGHDHKNSFVRSCRGIDLGYTQSLGFDEYGPGTLRGARIIQLGEPESYTTYTRTYREILGHRLTHPVKGYLNQRMPSSKEDAIQMSLRFLASTAGIIGAVYLLAHFVW